MGTDNRACSQLPRERSFETLRLHDAPLGNWSNWGVTDRRFRSLTRSSWNRNRLTDELCQRVGYIRISVDALAIAIQVPRVPGSQEITAFGGLDLIHHFPASA